jgi:hypothetical protein
MADIVITATSVVAGANAQTDSGTCGATITAGQAVYKDSTTKKWLLADSNGTAEARQAKGIALNGGAINQPVKVQTGGDITIGATITAGVALYLSDTPGGICPVADVGAGEYVCLMGVAKTTTVFTIGIQFPNVSL